MPETLSVQKLTKRYGQDDPVISDLSHDFVPGSVTVLSGPNGSGKTTLLRQLAVQSYPTSGVVLLGDLSIHKQPHEYLKSVGIVSDEPALPAHLNANELLEAIIRHRKLWTEHSTNRIATLLDQVLLDERRGKLIGTYSSGMLQKTQVAAAFATEPQVLLMDEPLRGLDDQAVPAVLELIKTFRDEGGVVVISSHLHETVAEIANEHIEMGS